MTGKSVAVVDGVGGEVASSAPSRALVIPLLCSRCQQPAGELRLPEPPPLELPAIFEGAAGAIARHFEKKSGLPLGAVLDCAEAGNYAEAIALMFGSESGALPVICEGCKT